MGVRFHQVHKKFKFHTHRACFLNPSNSETHNGRIASNSRNKISFSFLGSIVKKRVRIFVGQFCVFLCFEAHFSLLPKKKIVSVCVVKFYEEAAAGAVPRITLLSE